ncbi:MAG: insulinase family protein [Aquincola sp.]|nr:insulinase family protein [Aquincola sp.]
MSPSKTTLATLANGVRLVTLPLPAATTAGVAVFIRSGSAHESRAVNGISHMVEHMLFKGTATRDARRINVDAEALGVEVNAHTDRDHTAFYMRGLPEHAGEAARMLADLVTVPSFPADELERERQVLLQELAEDEDDPVSSAYKLFDSACYGLHAAALPVIGTRTRVQRLARDELVQYVQRQYRGDNIVVGAAGAFDEDSFLLAATQAFASLPAGGSARVEPPAYLGDVRTRAQEGSSQTHAVLGGAIGPRGDAAEDAAALAAAVLGEGMSSPLLHELREKRGLAYHASCAAEVQDLCGQFIIETSTAPERANECLDVVLALLHAHAGSIDAAELSRAHNQLRVRRLRDAEKPLRRLEDAALDLFTLGRVRSIEERAAALDALDAQAVRGVFERLLHARLSLAFTGSLKRAAGQRARERHAVLAR